MAATDLEHDSDLPRIQTGANPQHLIVSLLGDYWWGRNEHLPSAGLVALTDEFGITATSARAALSRLARRGLLESTRQGRKTFYGLSARAVATLTEERRRILRFGLDEPPWDGTWTVVIFSVPEDQRDVRHVLRTRLRWHGFGPLYDGVWVSPRTDPSVAVALLGEVGVTNSSIMVSTPVDSPSGTGDLLAAWDLDELRATYDDFIGEFAPLLDRTRRGGVGGAEALVARTRLIDRWREFPSLDPALPEAALPTGWPRREARHVFVELYDGLGPITALRFQQILHEYAPDLRPASYHNAAKSVASG